MAGIQVEKTYHVSLNEAESFTRDLPTGRTKIDSLKVRHFGSQVSLTAQGFLIKKDGVVGNARRHGDVDLDQLPTVLWPVVAPLMET